MKKLLQGAAAFLLLSNLNSQISTAHAQGTAFTYQGRLNSGTNVATGSFDLRFALFDALTIGTQQGNLLTNSATVVSNGLFMVTLDFGNQFPGANRWLEIAVRTNSGGSFLTLSPRQPLTPAPYAITAGSVVSGGLASGTYGSAVAFNNSGNNFSGAFSGNGANVTNVNAARLGGLLPAGFWQTSGNSGTFPGANILGTADNQPLVLSVNGNQAAIIIPTTNTANWIGGSVVNAFDAGVTGATIAGGGTGNYQGNSAINYVRGSFACIGGGAGNTASNIFSTVAGGFKNSAQGQSATVGGGNQNGAKGSFATVSGGFLNVATNQFAGVSGGYGNVAGGIGAFVGGGGYDGYTFAGNAASGPAATVSGGYGNSASGANSTIGGGSVNLAESSNATVGGGNQNTAVADESTVGGGIGNLAYSFATTIGGGCANQANGNYAVAAGGFENRADGQFSMVPGGAGSRAVGDYSFAAGQNAFAVNTGSFVWADAHDFHFLSDANNQARFRSTGGFIIVTGIDGSGIATAGASLNPGATSWSVVSDRNVKKNFQALDTVALVNKLASIPITHWNYNWEADTNTPHIGPMAQDFKAAFYPGRDDKSITTLEFDGVELAAIQGLNEKLEARSQKLETENAELKQKNDSLEYRLAALEKILRNHETKQEK